MATSKINVTMLATATPVKDATSTTKGIVQLAGDLSGTAASPTVPTKVTGPASATANGIARYSGTTGKIIQDSNGPIIGDNGATVLTTNNEKTPFILNGAVGYGTNNAPLANEIQFKPQNTFYGYGVLDWYCEDYTIKDVIMQAHRVEYTATQSLSDPTQPVNPADLHRHWSLYTSDSTRSSVIKRLDIPYFVDYANMHFQNGYLTADSFGNNTALTLNNLTDTTTTAPLAILNNHGLGSVLSITSLATGNSAIDISSKFGYKHTMNINNGAGLILTTDGTHTTSSSFGLAKLTNLTVADTNPTLNIDNHSAGKSLYIQNNGTEIFSVAANGTVNASNKITNVTDPASAQDAATKNYVDTFVGSSNITTLGTVGTGTWNGTTVAVAKGGTGQTTYTDGQLLVGNSTGNTLAKTTLTAGNGIAVTNGSGSITIANSSGYTLQFSDAATSPANATTYYFGMRAGNTFPSIQNAARIYIPRAGTVTAAYVYFFNGTSNSSAADTSTISFRLNATTDTTISSAVTNNATSVAVNNTGLSIAVSAGDFFEIKWLTPTWTTAGPAGTTVSGTVYITPTG